MTRNDVVFKCICNKYLDLSRIKVASIQSIVSATGLDKQDVVEAVNELCENGLIEKTTASIPRTIHPVTGQLIDKIKKKVVGYTVTHKGRCSDIFKEYIESYNKL